MILLYVTMSFLSKILSCIPTHIRQHSSSIKYTQLTQPSYNINIFSIIEFTISDCKRIKKEINSEETISILQKSFKFNEYEIQYEYISHFIKLSHNRIGIVIFGNLNSKLNLKLCDDKCLFIIRFTSNNSLSIFMNSIQAKILLYKMNNKWNKSVINYSHFYKKRILTLEQFT